MPAAKSKSATTSRPKKDDPEFVITRLFDAPREAVFRAWIDPKQLAKWWGPRGFATPVCELNAKPGGEYRIVMRSPDGAEYPVKGVFRTIVKPERIIMTQDVSEHPREWHDAVKPGRARGDTNPAGELFTTVTFEDEDGKTRLTVRTRFISSTIRDAMLKMGMTEGWSESLDRLSELLSPSETADREIAMTRIYDAPPELVFEAWTDPKRVTQWWGPNGFTTTMKKMDVRPGGVWEFTMHGPDGVDYPNKNVYVEVVSPQRIVYDHVSSPHFRMTATFTAEGKKTRLSVHMLFASSAELAKVIKEFRAGEGLKQTLARLAHHLEMDRH